MAGAEKDVEGKKRKRMGNIITIEERDSQESLEKVSDFLFFLILSPSCVILSFHPFPLQFLHPEKKMESGEQRPEVRGGEQVGARGVQQLEGRRLRYPLRRPFPYSCEQHLNCLYGIPRP